MIETFILAFGLSMDAFAVSIAIGIKSIKFDKVLAIKAGLFFGVFQALMPIIGYFTASGLDGYYGGYSHYVAFVVLSLVGLKMLYEGYSEKTEDDISKVTNKVLLILAIATSIDALSAGFTFDLLSINPFVAAFFIGLMTYLFSYFGVLIGTRGGGFLEDKAEYLGGIVLIAIAFKILLEYTLE